MSRPSWASLTTCWIKSDASQADVIIPNADLITNQVANWTLSNRRVLLIIPVGVACGSDAALVRETLIACAKTTSNVATPLRRYYF
jgi:small-conductance mechanosensitive channel